MIVFVYIKTYLAAQEWKMQDKPKKNQMMVIFCSDPTKTERVKDLIKKQETTEKDKEDDPNSED